MQTPPDLIADLYEAAVEPDGLELMSSLVRRALNIDSAGFWLIQGGSIVEMANTPDIRASEPAYLARYHAFDPWTNRDPERFGIVSLGSELFDERKLVETEFYKDFARHYGMFRPMGATIPLGDGTLATVAANRIAGPLLDEEDKARMQELIVHLRSALRLRLRFAALREVATLREDALDALAFPLVISSGDGQTAFVNKPAREASRRDGPLTVRNGRVIAVRAEQTVQLHHAIQLASVGEPSALGLIDRENRRVPVSVSPASARLSGQSGHVVLSLPSTRQMESDAVLRQAFGLSPAQAELCRLLAAGKTFEEAARSRGVAVATMRSHFKAVLERTGSANLRDLLRLVGSLPQLQA
ncbi:helix-turn-helix transcriptional regulator [Enterovirga sp. CN4-39]|uniref:helix-turn-helix transcriptional regulator n=1 Tax=Enterovirga sp. CN4-39 TaxID=3400910 RepID=UPI003BFE2B22